ncbi:class II glutamine amidotransferase domain-containing protein [Phytohabitans aurantiacus]|uniref:Glutamine amidotransferase type-2 domain-containing protein n=1 Tax=Phytohabitans aurantiacus TaxID=3016789 RepID=A0ABQ5QVX4_9ACTN|nr:hypothetical protein [Phytohabitans aurantiacus]GLH98037.1 hypothetical protein Pa4123_33120 [Phytohabitans aurantiacus]
MAGIAGTFYAPTSGPARTRASTQTSTRASTPEGPLKALSTALARRGPDVATWHAGGAALLVRAAMPAVHEQDGIAVVVDGIAEVSALASGYSTRGPAALVGGAEPYALILADPARGGLVLARNGDGPPLYYAETANGVFAASEPAALLAAGVAAEPDEGVVSRFIATGACDDTAATFYAGIRRVLPGEIVEITGGVRTRKTATARDGGGRFARPVLDAALGRGRIGVRFGHGLAGAATVGAALAGAGGPRQLMIYSATFPGLTTAAADYAAAVLGPVAASGARHRAQPFFADELDLDALLADLGEPVPDLDSYLIWATARSTAGEVDTLIDTAGGGAHLARIADRLESRYGVTVRFPLRALASTGPVLRAELAAIVEGTLPTAAARFATGNAAHSLQPPMRDLLLRMRAELAAVLLHTRLPGSHRASRTALAALFADGQVDTGALFRRYMVERWLRSVAPAEPPRPAPKPEKRAGGATWTRSAIATEAFASGDKLPEKVAWYVGERLAEAGRKAYREKWCVLVAARPVAVVQGRARPVWDIRPGALARTLHRFARPSAGLDSPWTAQVAVEQVGPLRAAFGPAASHGVRGPAVDAVAVVLPPESPDRVAADIMAALRTTLPEEAYATLAGCAIAGSAGVLAVAGDLSREAAEALCADDPFPVGGPIVVAFSTPPARKGGRPRTRGKK